MTSKTVTLILSFAVFGSFFFPLFTWHQFEMNGLNYILSTHIPPFKYFLLLIPFSTLFLFFDTLNNDDNFINRKIIAWIPLLSLIFTFILRYLNGSAGNNFSNNENAFSTIDIGFWMLFGFSLWLALVKGKKKSWYQHKNELVSFD